MAFATDRDLLVLEPNLFRDISFASQMLTGGTDGAVSGTSFSSASADFVAAGVAAGHVLLLNDLAVEIVGVVSATELTVSRLRAHVDDAAVPPPPGASIPYAVRSFRPQVEMMHRQVMRSAGIEPDGVGEPSDAATEVDVLNRDELAMVVSLGALESIFASAASLLADEPYLRLRAASYRDRFSSARQRARVRLDLDGDGVVDVVRHLNVVQFVRW